MQLSTKLRTLAGAALVAFLLVPGLRAGAKGPASPPGMIVYVCGARLNSLCRVGVDGRNPRTLVRANSTSFYATPSLSADGTRLAYVFANRAYAADPLGRNQHLLSDGFVEAVSLRPDGQRILLLTPVRLCPGPLGCPFIGTTGTLVDWSGADAHRRPGFFAGADWLSPGRFIAISAHEPSSLLTVPAVGCCGRVFLEAARLRFGEIAVSPDGETFAVSTYATAGSSVDIYLIDRRTKAMRRFSPPARSSHNDLYYSPAWSPDGKWLVFVRQNARRPLQRMLMIARAVPGSQMVSLGVLGVQPAWGSSS